MNPSYLSGQQSYRYFDAIYTSTTRQFLKLRILGPGGTTDNSPGL